LAESGNGVVEGRLVGRGVSVAGSGVAVDANVFVPGMRVGRVFCDGVQDARITITALIESRRIYFILPTFLSIVTQSIDIYSMGVDRAD
jgi:ACR3 family arsenite efflux pump ArsB